MPLFKNLKEKIDSRISSIRENRREASVKSSANSVYGRSKDVIKMNKEKSYAELSEEFLEARTNPKEVFFHKIDPVTLVLFAVIACFAFGVSLSATISYADTFYDNKFYFLFQNIKFLALGIVAMIAAVIFTKYLRTFTMLTIGAYFVAFLLLVLVLFIGTSAGGAQRWISIAGISIQPSEVAKTALVLMLALFMSVNIEKITDKKKKLRSYLFGIVIPLLFTGLFCGLVYLEKHNSGMIILAAIGVAVMFLGGADKKVLIGIGLVGIFGLLALVLLTGHGVDRIETWLDLLTNPDIEINDGNWQTIQGLYAISSGGLFGLGAGESRLKYGYVSQPQNDFIYPIICEELGFVGGVLVLILFFAIFLREMKLGMSANNMFVSLTICGLAVKLIIQVLLNILVVTALIPNTGISLPLFSAGGTAMIIQMLEFGIVLGLSRYCDVK